jgi:hypothetical protein
MNGSLRLLFLAVLVCSGGLVRAASDYIDEPDTGSGFRYQAPGHSWQERATTIPSFPKDDSLLPLRVDYPNFSYFIDPSSLSVDNDQVARYTVVIESTTGIRNVFYEGIRCDEGVYKIYAYGVGNGPFTAMADPKWTHIEGAGAHRYRRDLYKDYLCSGSMPRRNVRDILQRIKYPSDF